MYADWTDRIARGELPDAAPSRPQGRERNVVVTLWDWADPKVYLHDNIASDKRNPTVNSNGPIYGRLGAASDEVLPYYAYRAVWHRETDKLDERELSSFVEMHEVWRGRILATIGADFQLEFPSQTIFYDIDKSDV
jgi:hypothetical protein